MKNDLKSLFNFSSELNFYRFLFLIGGIFYYSFYHIFTNVDESTFEVHSFRLTFALLMVMTSILSFKVDWVKRNIVKFAYVETILIAIAYFFLLVENDLSISYCFRYMVILGISIVFKEYWMMGFYLLGCSATIVVIALTHPNPIMDPRVFLAASIAPTVVLYVVSTSRIMIVKRLEKQKDLIASQEKRALKFQVMENRQVAMSQQMNPHFISNALNSVQYYILKNDKIESINYLGTFASLMRSNLENSQYREIPISKELEALDAYLKIEQKRFADQFDYSIDVDENVDQDFMLIPPLILQPYCENAIIHGVTRLKEEKGWIKVSVKAFEHESYLLCTIEDNGVGIIEKKREGHVSLGTKITKSRVKIISELYGQEVDYKVINKADKNPDDHGVIIELRLPMIEGELVRLDHHFEEEH